MVSKVEQMLDLVQRRPALHVRILSGMIPGLLTRALVEPDLTDGTLITVG
jgi:hypothetical protein